MGKRKSIRRLLSGAVDMRIDEVINIMYSLGYELASIRGSHYRFTHPGLSTMIIPAHNGKVKKWYLKGIKSILNHEEI